MGYFREAAKGVSWIGAFRVSTRFIALVRTIILARILSPFHFGVFGIITLVLSFLEILTETGINVLLIQKRENIDEYINTAWIVSIFRGFVIAAIIVVSAFPISFFFRSSSVVPLLFLASTIPLIRGFINPSIVKFQKDLNFNKEFWFKLTVFSLDTTSAVLFSLILKNSTGLVLGLIVGALVELVLSFRFARPVPRLKFEIVKFRETISRGKWLTGAGIFQFLFRQGDDMVVGRLLGEGSLGIYQVAYKLSTLPVSEITDVFGKVVFPVYVRISDDKTRLRRAFFKTTLVISTLSVSVGVMIFLFSGLIVSFVLGDKWLAAIPVLKVLAIFGIIQAITNSGYSLLLAKEKNETVVKLTFVAILGLAVSIVPLVNRFGIIGAGLAALSGAFLSFPFMATSIYRLLYSK